ncbi:hypothetical protein, partial [Pseudomonas fluorescens]|uniref:hypothetical protein n=1 Tax=Pseudomonas fluorescens TaxID=294 RepID=UPI001CD75474
MKNGLFWQTLSPSRYFFSAVAPGVRIVVASADFPEKSYRGRKEIGRGVLSNRTKSRIAQDVAT